MSEPQPSMDEDGHARPASLNVVIGVLTFRRPEGIAKLLSTIQSQIRTEARSYDLTVVVVDNDPGASGRAAVEAFRTNGTFDLIYVVEHQPGIPFGRNRALDEAPAETDLFCFVDDDEWLVPGWLDAMLEVRAATGADCVYGPVEPVYPDQAPQYFVRSRVFERKKNTDRTQIRYAASNNVMFDYPLFRRLGLRFDQKMRYTGGTDYLFFNQAVRRGVKIFWAEGALVYDVIPASRMTWKWVLQRQYRLGNTFAISDVLHGDAKQRLYRITYGAARTMLGIVMLPALALSPRLGMRALTHILRGAGMVNGILGHTYQEYRRETENQAGAAAP